MFQASSWLLASHGGDVTITIHKRVKFYNLNQEELKTIYLIKKKRNKPNSRFLLPLMSKLLENIQDA